MSSVESVVQVLRLTWHETRSINRYGEGSDSPKSRRMKEELRSQRRFERFMIVTKMLMLVATGALAGAIVASHFIRRGSIPVVLLAAAICLGAIAVWRLRHAPYRRMDRSERARARWRSGAEIQRAVVAGLGRSANGLVAFHDFNAARGCFDHW